MPNTVFQKSEVGRRTILLTIGGAMIGSGILFGLRQRPHYDGTQIDPKKAMEDAALGAVKLVDIRTPKEWAVTGIGLGAIPLDMRRGDFVDELLQLVSGNRNRPVALICARGVRSARLARQLTEAGFTKIIDVPEGMLGSEAGPGWIARGLEVVK